MSVAPDNRAGQPKDRNAAVSVVAGKPFVSVIIPVFNDTARLRLCLEALTDQSYPSESYEVIVVDNASTEDLEPLSTEFPRIKLVREEAPGSYVARNTGIRAARGEVIAFTDSDCIPDRAWIENGVAALAAKPGVGLIAGRVDLFCKDPDRPTAVELYELLGGFDQDGYVRHKHFGATANVFTHRRVIEDVGPFDALRKSGGDKEWGQRVFAAGYQQEYCPQACVKHPARRTYGELFRKTARITWSGTEKARLKTIAGEYVRILTPPVADIAAGWRDQRLAGLKRKFAFAGVLLFIRSVRLYECTRQLLGGQQQR